MKNALRDWRLPVILAVPILLWAGLLYLIFQPAAKATASAQGDAGTIRDISTPWPAPIQAPYPTAAPPPGPISALPCSGAVTALKATAAVQGGNLVIKVVDQRSRPVVCAWLVDAPGQSSYFVAGETDATGRIVTALSVLPAHFHFVDLVYFGSVTTAVDFTR